MFFVQILKREINSQENFDISDLLEMDYPPKLEIAIQSVPTSPDAGPLRLHIKGFDRESTFSIQAGTMIIIILLLCR